MFIWRALLLVTPEDYEPPGFKAADTENFQFEEDPTNVKIGHVNTVSILLINLFKL